jgi:hypothetical protein
MTLTNDQDLYQTSSQNDNPKLDPLINANEDSDDDLLKDVDISPENQFIIKSKSSSSNCKTKPNFKFK